jgi:hypothetical protein
LQLLARCLSLAMPSFLGSLQAACITRGLGQALGDIAHFVRATALHQPPVVIHPLNG